jgi:methyl-accepting chemotaxis protein
MEEDRTSLFSRIGKLRIFAAIAERIRNKLLTAFLLVSLVPLIIASVVAYTSSANALHEEAFNKLEAIETIKAHQMELWFDERRADVKELADDPTTINATNEMLTDIDELGGGDHEVGNVLVRDMYLGKPELVDAGDGSAYSQVHAQYHAFFEEYATLYGYADLYIVDVYGDILYTAAKRDDFATNLETGLYADTNLASIFQATMAEADHELTLVEDFAHYAPSGEPASFIASPIYDHGATGGELLGALIMQLPLDRIDLIMEEATGLGDTGETYLVGPDYLWRSDSRFLDQLGVESTVLNPDLPVDTEASRSALAGGHGTQVIQDYRGQDVLSSWGHLVIQEPTTSYPEGLTYAIIAEKDQTEVEAPVRQMAFLIGGLVLASIVVVVVTAVLVSKGLTNQVDKISELFSMVGMGDFDARAAVISQDELGHMAETLNAMLDNTLTLIQSNEEREQIQGAIMKLLEEIAGVADRDLTVKAEVTADMTGAIADSFNMMILQLREIISEVQETTLQVSASANEVQATAEHLASGSEEQATQIVDTTAAIDEMAVSIQQVSENAALSATVGEQAVSNARQGAEAVGNTIEGMNRIRQQVQETAKRIKRLGESSQEIGEIVQLIGDIADRTSILALNASIQAAMAGEAGRGFAVVAEEVERLAERSTEATKQIDNLIRTIQNETYETIASMETMTNEVVEGSELAYEAGQTLTEIETVSNKLGELIQSISLAAKQQARGSETIARSMNDIAGVTQQTAAGTKQAAVSINNLAVLADNLRGSVSTFKLPGSGNGQNGHNGSDYGQPEDGDLPQYSMN